MVNVSKAHRERIIEYNERIRRLKESYEKNNKH